MEQMKPDPSKSSSTSPPEDGLLSSVYNKANSSPINTNTSNQYLDNVQFKVFIHTNIEGHRSKIILSQDSDANKYFASTTSWLNLNGRISLSQHYLSTNGRRLFLASQKKPYEQLPNSSGMLKNQLSQAEKNAMELLAGGDCSSLYQVGLIQEALNTIRKEYFESLKVIPDLKSKPELVSSQFVLKSAEFYREYPIGVDHYFVKSTLKDSLDRTTNRLHGTFRRTEEYGDGALNWYINYFNGVKYKEVILNSYVKGSFLRLEVKYNNIPKPAGNVHEQTPIALRRLNILAGQILDEIEKDLKFELLKIDEHKLKRVITALLPRSIDSKRIDKMFQSLVDTGTYTPARFLKENRATKHQLTALVKGKVIEPIKDHLPKELKRLPRDLAYRLCSGFESSGGVE